MRLSHIASQAVPSAVSESNNQAEALQKDISTKAYKTDGVARKEDLKQDDPNTLSGNEKPRRRHETQDPVNI